MTSPVPLSMKPRHRLPAVILLGMFPAAAAHAGEITKANNSDSLINGSSWVNNIAPGASDTALFDVTYGQTGTLGTGGPLSWGGIKVTTGSSLIDIQNTTAENHVGIGSGGIDMSEAARNLTIRSIQVQADQAWSIAAGRTLALGGTKLEQQGFAVTLAGTGTLNLQGGGLVLGRGDTTGSFGGVIAGTGAITKDGTGTFTTAGKNTYTGLTTINAGTLVLDKSAGAQLYQTNGFFGVQNQNYIVVNSGGTFQTWNWNYGVNNALAQLRNNYGQILLNGGTIRFDDTFSSQRAFTVGANGGTIEVTAGNTFTKDAGTTGSENIIRFSANSTLTVGGAGDAVIGDALGAYGNTGFSIAKTGNGTLTLTGANNYSGTTTISAGTVNVGNGGTSGNLGSGAITNNGSLVFNRSNDLTVGNTISGTGSLGKQGAGNLTLTNTGNTFSGDITVSGGTLTASGFTGSATSSTLGLKSGTRTITVGSGATMRWTSNNILGGGGMSAANLPAIVINGGSFETTRFNVVGNLTLNGASMVNANATDPANYHGFQFIGEVSVTGTTPSTISTTTGSGNHLRGGSATPFGVADQAGLLTISTTLRNGSGDYSGTAGLTKTGAGTLALTGGSVYGGSTTISEGTLAISGGGGIYRGGFFGAPVISIASGATLELQNWSYGETNGSLGGLRNNANAIVIDGGAIRMTATTAYGRGVTVNGGGATFEAAAGSTWTFDNTGDGNVAFVYNDNPSLAFAGDGSFVFNKSFSGTGGLTKTGSGTLTLAGSTAHTGPTAVSAGTLLVTGALGNTAVTVESGAAIGGTGSLAGSLTFDAGSFLDLSAANDIGVNTSDILSVTGSITLTDFAFTNLVGWNWLDAEVGVYKLINGGSSITLAGSTPTAANPYDFGNGKQGYFQQGSLQVVVIPEPASILLGGLGLLVLLRRRR